MNRCCPLSTISPVNESTNEYARPPRCLRRSSTTTSAPPSLSSTAAARPAKPPPTITTRLPNLNLSAPASVSLHSVPVTSKILSCLTGRRKLQHCRQPSCWLLENLQLAQVARAIRRRCFFGTEILFL